VGIFTGQTTFQPPNQQHQGNEGKPQRMQWSRIHSQH